MSDLIDKLNILVRARINSALSGTSSPSSSVPARGSGAAADDERALRDPRAAQRDVSELRTAIDQALNAEDAMQVKLDAARKQMEDLDYRADQALLRGDDGEAREAVQRLKTTERTVQAMEADLATHRRATSQLIEQVNHLEAILADQLAQQNSMGADLNPQTGVQVGEANREAAVIAPDEQPASTPIAIRVNVGKPAVADTPTAAKAKTEAEPGPLPVSRQDQIRTEVERATIEDDLARRRVRLSAPDKPSP
jgi:hypothetical protein